MLPRVGIEDVPASLRMPEGDEDASGHLTRYRMGTNGLVYQQLVMPLPALEPDQLQLLPIYSSMLSEVGAGSDDYLRDAGADFRWQWRHQRRGHDQGQRG